MKNENELDQFFKKGLAEPDLPFNELDWEKMEQKLEPHKSKRAVLLWPTVAAGIAASILLAFFLMFQTEESLPVKSQSAFKAPIVKPSTEIKEQQVNKNQELLTAQSNAKKESVDKGPLPLELVALSLTQQTIATTEGKDIKLSELSDTLHIASSIVETPVTTLIAKKHITKANTAGRLSFSVIAAPDISSSQANLSPKVSTNLGLLATYSLTNKISLTTGVIYAKKLYDYGGASTSAYGNPGKSMETYANCKVLDIPLNLNYRLYEKGSNAISVNTGLSSYIMLNEKYKYVSNDDLGNTKSSVLEIVNQNQHLLGVANISVSFTRKINSQVSIGVQPFLKIPLTGIGYHDSKLKSTGVAFSLNLNMRQK
jgi:hypothetical protein